MRDDAVEGRLSPGAAFATFDAEPLVGEAERRLASPQLQRNR